MYFELCLKYLLGCVLDGLYQGLSLLQKVSTIDKMREVGADVLRAALTSTSDQGWTRNASCLL